MPKVLTKPKNVISLDTETTGLDFKHGARPFLVTICKDDGENLFWEFEVDPLTRMPIVPKEDLFEIEAQIEEADEVVCHNTKFDVKALWHLGIDGEWPWHKTHDTLFAGHLLASNQPHDLTTMALVYLGVNIEPYEEDLYAAVEEARRYARSKLPGWRIAKNGLPEMPSAKDKVAVYDYWLPRAIALHEDRPKPDPDCKHRWGIDDWTCRKCKGHRWWTVCSEYANTDSSVTLPLHRELQKRIKERKLDKIYAERLKLMPILFDMEHRGMSLRQSNTEELIERLTIESEKAHRICVNMSSGIIDELPDGGVSNALRDVVFGFDRMKCEGCGDPYEYENELGLGVGDGCKRKKCNGKLAPVKGGFNLQSPKETATGKPSMDKNVLDEWIATLPNKSKEWHFIKNLRGYRIRKTALSYLDSYSTFWLPGKAPGMYYLYSSLNPTGTATLRFSSSSPNEQQISKQGEANLRYCFGPEDGYEWWSMDASNIELRLPAYEAGEEAMIELFERPNDPPYFGSNHLLFFDILHPDKWDRNDPEGLLKAKKKYAATWYQWTKNGDFAVQYGAVAESGTADRAYHVKGAQARIEKRLSKIKKLSSSLIKFADKHGYVETIPDKTVDPERGYPLLCSRTKWGKVLPTVPLSYHVQGSAMWWMCKAMSRCYEQLKHWPKCNLLMQIHDELVFQFPKRYKVLDGKPVYGNLPQIRILKKLMEEGGNDIGIPTLVNVEYHANNWAEGVSVKL